VIRSFLCFTLASVLLAAAPPTTASPPPAVPPPPTPPNYPGIYVARGTIIPVTVTKDIRVGGLGKNEEEKKIRFEVAQDVTVGGYMIAAKGDLVEGHYTNQNNVTKRVFSTNVSQEVALDIDVAVNFCGDTIHLEFERTFVGGARGGFLSFGVHAHDAVFEKGLVLKTKTDRAERSICAAVSATAPLPLPTNMVVPDEEASSSP
jgi:hypothetical protein